MMERQLQQMVRLIDDLLDVSRISRGKIELHRERVDLAAVLRSALETSRPLIEQSGHQLTLDLPPAPVFVEADLTRLAQVFANLLNNAAKFTERGGHIQIAVRPSRGRGRGARPRRRRRHPPRHAAADLRDVHAGGPVAGESPGRARHRPQLVKRLVEMHGGSVEAHSQGVGLGSEFVVRLPVLQAAAEEPQPMGDGEKETSASARRRILVADDNTDAAESLALLLEIQGNEVRTAQDGLEAVEVAAELQPDVILLDIGMPRLNGYDACRRIREQPWGRETVIIALTGWGQDEDKRRSREAGFDHHLVKPVEPTALAQLLAPE